MKNHHTVKFQITDPLISPHPKFGSPLFRVSAEPENLKISNQVRLLILNVETEPMFSVYPTGHLCVIYTS